jgi:hypothetical protein
MAKSNDDYDIHASPAMLTKTLELLDYMKDKCLAEHHSVLAGLRSAAQKASNESEVAAAVRRLEPEVAEARRQFAQFDVARVIALLATERAIADWRGTEEPRPPLGRAKSQWLIDARDEVAGKIRSGLMDSRLSSHLRDTLYQVVEPGKDGASRMMVGHVRQGPMAIAALNALRLFDLSVPEQHVAFMQQFHCLALDENDRGDARVVDVISRGGSTTLRMLEAYLAQLAASSKAAKNPQPVVIRILMPHTVTIDPGAWSGAEEVLNEYNAYLWVRRTTTTIPIHGNLIRCIKDSTAFDLGRWWRGKPDPSNHTVRDLHLAIRGATFDSQPVYLYVPCEILGPRAQELGRQIAKDFDNLWSPSPDDGTAPRLCL